jgi:hypothetical protein
MTEHKICVPLIDRQIVLVVTPKVASMSIISAVLRHYGIKAELPLHGNPALAWLTGRQVESYIPHYARAMFVRNPYDRLVGAYEYHVVQGKASANMLEVLGATDLSFGAFVEVASLNPSADPHLSIQCQQLGGVGFVGKFENLEEDWARFGFSSRPLDHINAGKTRPPYQDYYTPELRELVGKVWAPDFMQYDYTF